MYDNHTTDTLENQEFETLSDKDKTGKERPWGVKKMNTLELSESYKRLGMKKSYRVADCGSFLEFKRFHEDGSIKLNRANFCKVRLCPMCAWRRSLKTFGQVSKVMDQATKVKDYRFIFLTLTVKNCEGEELSKTIDALFHAYKKLSERKKFKLAIKGWFRALEVTHNLEQDTYHPHFHIILMVNKSYFKDTKIYMSQAEWTDMWQSCLKVDYTPLVDVRAFKTKTKLETSKSVAEVATYTVKDNDYIVKDADGTVNEELTDSAVWVLDNALTHRRLVAFGGELKDIHKALNLDDAEDGDLINTDNDEELREDLDYVIERYQWHIGYRQYVKFDNKAR